MRAGYTFFLCHRRHFVTANVLHGPTAHNAYNVGLLVQCSNSLYSEGDRCKVCETGVFCMFCSLSPVNAPGNKHL